MLFKFFSVLITIVIAVIIGILVLPLLKDAKISRVSPLKSSPAPTLKPIVIPTSVKPSDAYTIILVGDSLTQYLGDNTEFLRKHLKTYYGDENATPKGKVFGIFNYGFGSTNILSLQDVLENETSFMGQGFQAILKREFDLILIESFANNPLSQFPLEEGLKKTNEALDKAVRSINEKHPNSVIAFVATIAPVRNRYGEGAVVLSPEKRREWADERIAYFKNHIQYAKAHNIPLINIYEKSLTKEGDGNIDYINTNDFIHPSPKGVDFISKEIADWIYNNKVLPPP